MPVRGAAATETQFSSDALGQFLCSQEEDATKKMKGLVRPVFVVQESDAGQGNLAPDAKDNANVLLILTVKKIDVPGGSLIALSP